MLDQRQNYINPAANQAAVPVVTMPTIASFQFQNQNVRIVPVDGVEYFIAKDLAPILGFKNARQAVRSHVSKGDRYGVQNLDAMGRDQTLLSVNESGMYALILGSKNPKAQAFRHWVTSEVIPRIRRTGKYELQRQIPALLGQIVESLRGRGAAKSRQLNKIIAHRDGSVSLRVGNHWVRHVQPLASMAFPKAHGLREGAALMRCASLIATNLKASIH